MFPKNKDPRGMPVRRQGDGFRQEWKAHSLSSNQEGSPKPASYGHTLASHRHVLSDSGLETVPFCRGKELRMSRSSGLRSLPQGWTPSEVLRDHRRQEEFRTGRNRGEVVSPV